MLALAVAAVHSGSVPNRPCRRAYDHRLRDLVCQELEPALFAQLGIPRSTAASWIRRGSRAIVTTELFAEDEHVLRARVLKLERRVQVLLGIVRLLFAVVRLFGLRLDSQRVPSGEIKSSILAAIERAKGSIPRQRVYPAKPKDGIRATGPSELLHIDVTVIKLIDGTRAYLHGVIDNFSRRILAWKLALRLEPTTTCQVLAEAVAQLPAMDNPATVYADSGVENVNGKVDDLLGLGKLRRVLAQVEVSFSNSLIEAFWRSLKSNWIYINELDSLAVLERLIAFYVAEHNTMLPHSAFQGQTPDEIYFGRGDNVPQQLAEARRIARDVRLQTNRGLSCEVCRAPLTVAGTTQCLPPEKREPQQFPR